MAYNWYLNQKILQEIKFIINEEELRLLQLNTDNNKFE